MPLRIWKIGAVIVAIPLLVALSLWLWVAASPDQLAHPLATYVPWPIACSTRGCITTMAWHEHWQSRVVFAQATQTAAPTSAEALQTLIYQHLAHHGLLRSPVTGDDVRRYREEILNLHDASEVHKATGLSLEEYDARVVEPLLEQEAIRQQKRAETPEELYKQLAQDRFVAVLLFGLSWDQNAARVTANSLYNPRLK